MNKVKVIVGFKRFIKIKLVYNLVWIRIRYIRFLVGNLLVYDSLLSRENELFLVICIVEGCLYFNE